MKIVKVENPRRRARRDVSDGSVFRYVSHPAPMFLAARDEDDVRRVDVRLDSGDISHMFPDGLVEIVAGAFVEGHEGGRS